MIDTRSPNPNCFRSNFSSRRAADRRRFTSIPVTAFCLICICTAHLADVTGGNLTTADEFPEIVDTQPPGEKPPTALDAAAAISVPDGFEVTLFAGEPHVHQPIGFDIDERGRLWVAECYTYTSRVYDFDFRDRIVILADQDNDGRFDDRRVFWDQGKSLTSVTLGYGYVWILNEGRLQRIADKDHDDHPDSEPETLLDGFNVQDIGHNIVNGLHWGPDGWLYGRHGITATSYVGAPGTPQDARTALNCSIWRYQPITGALEVVCNGTTNPWGLDFDAHGEFFFTNNVIGHLWHVVPGAHYERMFGVDFNPYLYELMPQTADHYHWDAGQKWTDSRDGKGRHGELGGGHSHCGGMIYLGDNWPAEYRGSIFMCNTHGRRVNRNNLQRRGSGYVATRAPDFLMANQPWFRGVELRYGPDGGVYVSDWTDLGECHDHDGVHRTSGRIYKIVYAANRRVPDLPAGGLRELDDMALVHLQRHANEWYVRHARRLLHERHLSGKLDSATLPAIRNLLRHGKSTELRLRGLWLLHSLDQLPIRQLLQLLDDPDEHLVVWATRLLTERVAGSVDGRQPITAISERLAQLAGHTDSGLVAIHLASAAQRFPNRERWQLAMTLAHRQQEWVDDRFQLMVWYALEGAVIDHGDAAAAALGSLPHERHVRYLARRLCEAWNPSQRDAVFARLYEASPARQVSLLQGVVAALRGRRKLTAPSGWSKYVAASADSAATRELIQELQVIFGDGLTMNQLLDIAKDGSRDVSERRQALEVLIENRVAATEDVLINLVNDRALAPVAVAGLANFRHPETARRVLGRWRLLDRETRLAAVNTLATRRSSAAELASALESGTVSPDYISAFQARRMRAYGDPEINRRLDQYWGQIRESTEAKKQQIERWREVLTGDALAEADIAAGGMLFEKTCAKCHRLYGKGGTTGPDLTGSNRDNLDYLLSNILDPSAILAASYRMSTVETIDGRVLSGVVQDQGGATLKLLTPEKELTIARDEIEEISPTQLSLMPEGLLENLSPQQVRDLIAFLQRK